MGRHCHAQAAARAPGECAPGSGPPCDCVIAHHAPQRLSPTKMDAIKSRIDAERQLLLVPKSEPRPPLTSYRARRRWRRRRRIAWRVSCGSTRHVAAQPQPMYHLPPQDMLAQAQVERDAIARKMAEMESNVIVGGVNLVCAVADDRR